MSTEPELLLVNRRIDADETVITAPYRSNYYGIGVCLQGAAHLRVNLDTHAVEAGWLIALSPHLIKQWLWRSPDFHTLTVFFTPRFLPVGSVGGSGLADFDTTVAHVFRLTSDQQQQVADTLYFLQRKCALPAFQGTMAHDLVHFLVREVATCCAQQAPSEAPRRSTRGYWLTAEFKRLLSQYCTRERSLSFYADQLCVTPNHLSETVKVHTGRTAGEWVGEAVVLEAKVRLQDPVFSIAHVANCLHFADQSAFGRFFRQATGVSPSVYRQANLH